MGRWSDSIGLPLPACSPDAFLHTTAGDSLLAFEDEGGEPSFLRELGEEWLEGRSLPEPCDLGPVLYESAIDLDLSEWM